ncbi:hypothetical protein C8F01DRAFT_1238484 [Mycena amicta]|nr:hypothetical protein C8F01DRAFT_1238484 [Mycena amicta]
MLSTSAILALLPFIAGIHAINDWTVPCTSGSCSYDLPSTNETVSSGSLKIWGGVDAITDITNAADWEILDCDPTALAQDIRLVCKTDPDDPDSKCAHLYQNIGAVNKIVRLPENCGASAFARIAKAWVPADQSIPEAVQKRLIRRAGVPPVVKALHIDTNFDAVAWSKTGKVNIAIQGANVPGLDLSGINTGSKARRVSRRSSSRGVTERGFFDKIKDGLSKAGDAIKEGAEAVGGAVSDAAGAVKDGAVAAAGAVGDKAQDIATQIATAAVATASEVTDAAKSVSAESSVDVNKSFDTPISFDKSVNLFNDAISCGPASLSLNVNMDASADMQATISVVALGTVVPPQHVQVQRHRAYERPSDITGSLDSGLIPAFEVGIPGFDFPGILTVGPSFTVDAQINGLVDIPLDMTVGVNMDLLDATIAFPPDSSNAPAENSFSLGNTPLTLNAVPSVQSTGIVTATLTPKLSFGISALGGKGEAEIFFAVPASAQLTLNLDASAGVEKTINSGADDGTTVTPPSFGGCVNVAADLNVNVGADGSFFGLFNKVASKSLFSKNFQIFRKCFGDQATTARRWAEPSSLERRFDFACPAGIGAPAKSGITDGTIDGASIESSSEVPA